MRIARRTSGGRGEYELAGEADSLRAADFLEKEMVLALPGIDLPTGVIVSNQGGKPRLKLGNGGIQIQRQLAALLLMPKPIRADDAMADGPPVLRADEYAIETLEIERAAARSAAFLLTPGVLQVRNATSDELINVRNRFRRVRALWANRNRFDPGIRSCLAEHQQLLLGGGAPNEQVERAVGSLIEAVGGDDPVEVLDNMPTDLVAPLCAKPFLILTGASGTGKSRSAIDLGMWLDYGAGLPGDLAASRDSPSTALAFIPVGANWTDQRDLLGYRNPFGAERQRPDGTKTNLTYAITPLLRLLLRAMHPSLAEDPHVLLLDEMNLSHVERYFSTFLSVLEADRAIGGAGGFELVGGEDIALIAEVLESEGTAPIEAEAAAQLEAHGCGLGFPPNVFIVGTVNVDETTYMFSPKVLDRAFVRELVSPPPEQILNGDAQASSTASGQAVLEAFQAAIQMRRLGTESHVAAASFTKLAAEAGLGEPDAGNAADTFSKVLAGMFKLLSPVGFGFGHRVVNELVDYLQVEFGLCRTLDRDPAEWPEMIDMAVLMKILPKIHGNRRKLGDSIKAVAAFLGGEGAPEASYAFSTTAVAITAEDKLPIALERSQAKAMELHRNLQATGYTTFIS